MMSARRILLGLVLAGSLMLSSGAAAKEFRPGDLSVCGTGRCAVIRNQSVLNAVGAFYYDGAKPPTRARSPRLGVPFLRIEFSNGYVSGIVAGAGLDRFLSYGVNLDRFRKGVWYRVPYHVASEMRGLTLGLTPLPLTEAALTGDGAFVRPTSGLAQASPHAPRSITSVGHGSSLPWPLVLVPLVALAALALSLTRRRRARLLAIRPSTSTLP